MPSMTAKLYSVAFKYHYKRLLAQLSAPPYAANSKSSAYGTTTRATEATAKTDPSFADGVATKDLHIDPSSSLSVRIFLPTVALSSHPLAPARESAYGGYSPPGKGGGRKLPVVVQFHGGGFVSGSNESVENDVFCRRMAKLCDAIVVAVGYRLAPETKYPGAFEDGFKVLSWLAKQFNLAACRRSDDQGRIFDSFGASMVEPWLAAHGDPSRCVLLGASSGANIANYVVQKAVDAGKLIDPVKIVALVLMYPFFLGTNPTRSEVKLAHSYMYDKAMCNLAWKLFLPDGEFGLDHPAVNPLAPGRQRLPLKQMPPTLTVVAEHDPMRDRAIAYSAELRKANVDAPVLEYKDAVHDFATLGPLIHTRHAQVCAEDLALWVKKYISLRGHEFSY